MSRQPVPWARVGAATATQRRRWSSAVPVFFSGPKVESCAATAQTNPVARVAGCCKKNMKGTKKDCTTALEHFLISKSLEFDDLSPDALKLCRKYRTGILAAAGRATMFSGLKV